MLSFIVNAILLGTIFYSIHHSLKMKDRANRKFYKHYFVVMALFLSIDNFLGFLLYRIPYYQIFKLSLILWLGVPMGTGPHFMYNVYVKNIYQLFEGDIDAVLANFRSYKEQIVEKYNSVVNSSKKTEGEVELSGKEDSLKKKIMAESSDVDASNSVASSEEGK